jgi:hypothetical protein
MQTQTTRSFRRTAIGSLTATLLSTATLVAWADEPSPWYIGASQAFTHDSNVYRVTNGPGDNYSTTSLLGGFDQPIGRQRLHATAQVGYNKYQDQSTLDNTSYAVNAGWDWATIEKLSGSVNASASQSLATLNGNAVQPTLERNQLKAEQINASVRWGGDSLVSVFGNYGHSRVRFSALPSLPSDSTGDTASVGVNYRLGGDLTVGTALRFTHTDSPFAIALVPNPTGPSDYAADSSNGRNLDLLADWRYSAQTNVSARLSWTHQTYNVSPRSFSGLTGAVSANYAPTAKLTFSGSISREAGTNGSYFNVINASTGDQSAFVTQNSTTTDSLILGATYAATAKISVNAGVVYRRATYDTGNNDFSDNYRRATLGVNWAVTRSALLACNVSRESRSLIVNAYDANVFGCLAQITLR